MRQHPRPNYPAPPRRGPRSPMAISGKQHLPLLWVHQPPRSRYRCGLALLEATRKIGLAPPQVHPLDAEGPGLRTYHPSFHQVAALPRKVHLRQITHQQNKARYQPQKQTRPRMLFSNTPRKVMETPLIYRRHPGLVRLGFCMSSDGFHRRTGRCLRP